MPEMKPVLFNTEMVRANMAGLKTNTRRVMKPQPVLENGFWRLGDAAWSEGIKRVIPMPNHSLYERMPYKPGDILYVRENWAITSELPGVADGGPVYMADYTNKELKSLREKHFRWRPSIHMPKELARLFLRVTDVHAERLRQIEIEGFIKEGIKPRPLKPDGCKCIAETDNCHLLPCPNRDAYEHLEYALPFSELWDSTMKPAERELYGWNANPWVWVIAYERCEKPGGTIECC